jgi:hypothetical protein
VGRRLAEAPAVRAHPLQAARTTTSKESMRVS